MASIDLWQPGTVVVRTALNLANASQSSRQRARIFEAARLVSSNAVFEDWKTCIAEDTGPLLEHLVEYDFENCVQDLLDIHSIGNDSPTPKEVALLECENPRAQHSFKSCDGELSMRNRTMAYIVRLFEQSVDGKHEFESSGKEERYFWDRRAKNVGLGLDFTPRHGVLSEIVKTRGTINTTRERGDFLSKEQVSVQLKDYQGLIVAGVDINMRIDKCITILKLRPKSSEIQNEMMFYWHFMANLLIMDLDYLSGGPDRKIFDTSTTAAFAHHYPPRVWELIQHDDEEYNNFLQYQRNWILLNEVFSWYQAWRKHVYNVVKSNWERITKLGIYLAKSHDRRFRQQVVVRNIGLEKYKEAKESSVFYWFLKKCEGYKLEFHDLMRDYAFKDYRGWPEKGNGDFERGLVEKAMQRARDGHGYTIARSIRINVVDSILKRKWSHNTVFDKLKTSQTSAFFNGDDYVVADPPGKVIMLYAVDDAWLESAPRCEQEIRADNNTVLARIIASVLGPSVVGIDLTGTEEQELIKAADGNMNKLVNVARNIISRHKFVVSISDMTRRLARAKVKKQIFSAVLREIVHDLLGEEHDWFVSVKSPRKFKCFFESLYHTEVIDGTSTLVVDRAIDIGGAKYNNEDGEKEGYVITKSGCKKLYQGRYRMHIENKKVEWRNFNRTAKLGMVVGDDMKRY